MPQTTGVILGIQPLVAMFLLSERLPRRQTCLLCRTCSLKTEYFCLPVFTRRPVLRAKSQASGSSTARRRERRCSRLRVIPNGAGGRSNSRAPMDSPARGGHSERCANAGHRHQWMLHAWVFPDPEAGARMVMITGFLLTRYSRRGGTVRPRFSTARWVFSRVLAPRRTSFRPARTDCSTQVLPQVLRLQCKRCLEW
jgi:hypothetical protein